ncbi:diguanylate cyclase [Halomonas sp. Bachu 37]|uniref:sensor domain-containing diguanylate cyclase n=1 Tax=Halomonas kashgarensis TaxID=3084920 RepID=UPI003216AA0C
MLHSPTSPLPSGNDEAPLPELPCLVAEHLQNCSTLPAIPGVVFQVLQASRNPDSSLSEYIKAIERDPALTLRLISVANSALHGADKPPVSSCQAAVNRLGTDTTLAVVLGFSLIDTTKNVPGHMHLWQRAIIAALSVQCLCEHLCPAESTQLFTLALLQDIGMLVFHEIDSYYPVIVEKHLHDHDALVAQEKLDYGCDHALAGAWLSLSWGAPVSLATGIANSHDIYPNSDPGGYCLNLSSQIAEAWLSEEPEKRLNDFFMSRKPGSLLNPELFSQVIQQLQELLPPMTRLFNIIMPPHLDAENLLLETRQALLNQNQRLHEQLSAEREKFKELERHNELLDHQSRTDPLTGISNRSHLEKHLNEFFYEAERNDSPFSVIFIDLDHFKQLNDRHGHQVGDQVLRSFAQLLAALSDEHECLVGRYGGEEFLVLLPQKTAAKAEELAQSLSHSLAKSVLALVKGEPIKVTASIGIASMSDAIFRSPLELIEAADQGMYLAKRRGRARISRFMDSA